MSCVLFLSFLLVACIAGLFVVVFLTGEGDVVRVCACVCVCVCERERERVRAVCVRTRASVFGSGRLIRF